ncbi:MAG TPA: hypothetical protein PK512_08595, partial [bacterium]|nr:hypothetical protein [bacterium]
MLSQKKRLGEILVEKGIITEEILNRALSIQQGSMEKLGDVFLKMGVIKEEDLYSALSDIYNVPYVNLDDVVIDSEIVRLVPEHICRRYMVIPLNIDGDRIMVAMSNPVNIYALDDIRIITGKDVDPVLASERQITQVLDRIYTIQKGLEETLINIGPSDEDAEATVEV